jgi:hypothetical protein
MMRRSLLPWIVLSGITLSLAAAPPGKQKVSVQRLSWLAGCWEGIQGERRIDEQWMKPAGGTMLGMSRAVAGDKTRDFEYTQILEREGQLVMVARPSGQPEASFSSIEITDSKVVFENKSHDFPQRIIYRRNPDGSLAARIEGEQGGTLRGIDYPMRRTKCAAED